MHRETHDALQVGFDAQSRAVENIYKAIQLMQVDIAKLLVRSSDFESQDLGIVGRDTVASIADTDSEDGIVRDNVKLMKRDVEFASLLAESMSAGGQTVEGTSKPRSNLVTTDHIREFAKWKPWTSSRGHSDDEEDLPGESSLSGIGVDSPMRRAVTPIEAAGDCKPPPQGNLSNALNLDTNEPDEMVITHIDRCYYEARQAYEAQDYSSAERHLLETTAVSGRDRGVVFGSLPFEKQSEFRQFLALIMSKNFKFSESAQEYWALIGEAGDNADRFTSLCFELAEMYQAQYAQEGKKEVLKDAEACAMHAFKSALRLSARIGSDQWPRGHPTLQQTVEVLVEVFEATDRVIKADTYRKAFPSGTKSGAPHGLPIPRRPPRRIHNPPPSPPPTASRPSISQSICISNSDTTPQSVNTPTFFDGTIHSTSSVPHRYFLMHYSNIEERDAENLTALLLACKSKKLDDVRILLERENGPDLMAQDSVGCTCLHLAILGSSDGGFGDEIVKLLLRHRADINARTNADEYMTPLHYAAKENKLNSVGALLDADADIEAMDHVNRTPLMLALDRRNEDICRLLVDRGAKRGHKSVIRFYGDLWDAMDNAKPRSASGDSSRSRFSFFSRRPS